MTGEQDDATERAGGDVGSLGEEAAKLLEALNGWAREHTDDRSGAGAAGAADGVRRLADEVAGAVHGVGEHVATDGPECRWCPVCRVLHVVRQTSPEVRDHLVSAAGSLLEAAASALATHVPADGDRPRRDGDVERIDLDEDTEDWGTESTESTEDLGDGGRP